MGLDSDGECLFPWCLSSPSTDPGGKSHPRFLLSLHVSSSCLYAESRSERKRNEVRVFSITTWRRRKEKKPWEGEFTLRRDPLQVAVNSHFPGHQVPAISFLLFHSLVPAGAECYLSSCCSAPGTQAMIFFHFLSFYACVRVQELIFFALLHSSVLGASCTGT